MVINAKSSDLFNPAADPPEVVIDFRNSRVWDHSGLEAIVDVAQRYDRAGTRLHLLNLSENCQGMLDKANVIAPPDSTFEDSSCRVAISDLGETD